MTATVTYPTIFDGHNDTIVTLAEAGRSFFERAEVGHLDLPRAQEAGLGGGFFAIYIRDRSMAEKGSMPLEYAQSATLGYLGRLLQIVPASGGRVKIIRSSAELQRCLDEGIFAVLIHFEGAEALDSEGHALEAFYAAGLRSVGLTHSRRNRFAHGVPFKNGFPHSPDTGPGLTEAGKELIRQLNRRKVMIDLSHITERGFWDVAAISDAPLVASHSNAYALTSSPRNLTDRQLDAIRERRGVAGVNFAVRFLREDGATNAETPISRLVEHIDYMVARMGIECVALGSDFDGTIVPAEVKDATGLPRLMQALTDHGYSREDLRKLAHGNWLRVLRATWDE